MASGLLRIISTGGREGAEGGDGREGGLPREKIK